MPGSPGTKLVCTVSVLAMPAAAAASATTISARWSNSTTPTRSTRRKKSSAQAWWDKHRQCAGSQQAEWREHARRCMRRNCRKPPEKDKPVQPAAEGLSGFFAECG